MNDIATTNPSRRELKETLLSPEMEAVFRQLVPRHQTPERMMRLAIACITRTPRLLEVPQVQVLGALVQCAGLGLEPNSPLQHAHLIPFKNNRTQRYDLQMIIGYRGYVELGRRTGKQRWVHADVVRPDDKFEYTYGNDAHLHHRPGRGAQERQAPTDAYCFVQLDDGFAFVVLPEWEIMRHREHSFAWRQEKDRSIWIQHADRMWRKTAIRVLYSGGEVPLDTELAMAVATDDQRMDWRAMGEMAMKGGKDAIEHLKEGMDTFIADQDPEPESGEEPQPELRSQVRRAGPPTPRDIPQDFASSVDRELYPDPTEPKPTPRDIPQTAPGRATDASFGGGGEGWPPSPHRGATGGPPGPRMQEYLDSDADVSAAGSAPAGQQAGKRKRRSYRKIDEDSKDQMLMDIESASSEAQLEAIYASSDYERLRNRAVDLADEIAAVAEEKRRWFEREIDFETRDQLLADIESATSEAHIDAIYASSGYERLCKRAEDLADEVGAEAEEKRRRFEPGEKMIDRGESALDNNNKHLTERDWPEPKDEVMPDVPDSGDKTAAGAENAAPADTTHYKLLGLTGTLMEMLPAAEWFGELEERIGEASPDMREKWLTVNGGIIKKILIDRPDLSERLQEVVAKSRA